MTKRIAVLVSGSGSNLQSIIDEIDNQNIKNATLALVISSKEGVLALERAKKHGISHMTMSQSNFNDDKEYGEALIEILKTKEIAYIVLAGFLSILPSNVIKAYKDAIINIHPSLIPSFCGRGFYGMHVHNAVYKSGVKITGATVHFVDTGIDTGRILHQESVKINPEDTPQSIAQKVLKVEHKILPMVLNALINHQLDWQSQRVFIKI